jgi:hypothetical protein
LEDLGLDDINIKLHLKEIGYEVWTGTGTDGVSCKTHGNELSGSIKLGKFLTS